MRRGNCCQNNNSLTASFERGTQQLIDNSVHIKAYICRVYNWHTGPHANLIEITVPTKLASDRAWTRLPLAMRRASVDNWSVSHLSVGTLKYPSPRLTSIPRCFLSSIGIKPLLGKIYLETCFEADSFDSYSHQLTRSHASLWEEEVVEVYGKTLIPHLLQNITISIITLEKTQGVVESSNGRHVST